MFQVKRLTKCLKGFLCFILTFFLINCNTDKFEFEGSLDQNFYIIYGGEEVICNYNFREHTFNLTNYGYAKLILFKDSTYNFNLEILKDVIYEDKELNIHKVLLNSGFKRFNAGKFSVFNSKINFQDYEGNVVLCADYNFNLDTLKIYFLDSHQKNWNLIFIKNKGE